MLRPSRALRAVQWSKTLDLPKSTFPPRALEAARTAYLKQCTDDLYSWQAAARQVQKPFVLHDGPPYANGPLHIGHALNKVLKDIICRFEISRGKRVHYRPGWDCHGLPIELKALQQKEGGQALLPAQVREVARKLATDTIEKQRDGFKQWGIVGDWSSPYITMDKSFEIEQLRVFKVMVQKGLIYRQFKPVHWSPSSGTALAEAELEYDDQHVSHSAFIKYKLSNVPEALRLMSDCLVYALIWTTTPWTLPANRAIAYHNRIQYCAFRVEGASEVFLVASARLTECVEKAGLAHDKVHVLIDGISGADLFGSINVTYINPFRGYPATDEQPLLHGDFVTAESGTGLVHLAPGHGPEDYLLCAKHGISAFAPVDDQARFTSDAYPQEPSLLEGKDIAPQGVHAVLGFLRSRASPKQNLVWAEHAYTHKSPIDWRTKKPTIIRATAQWFADVESIKADALKSLENVKYIPDSGKSRLEGFINGRSQWCISRQRAWGVPIPALYNVEGEAIMTEQSVDHIINVIDRRGIDAWWTDGPDDPCWVSTHLPKGSYTRGRDTMDVWFDSGTSWTQIPVRKGQAPADVYIEGTDQHRGWFQSCLLTYVANQSQLTTTASAPDPSIDTTSRIHAPYKTLITHGFILDAVGKKMSKSIGNVISPDQIISGALLPPLKRRRGQGSDSQLDSMGPDALRLWVAMSDYKRDVTISEAILKAVNSSLHKYRVTFKWLLGACATYVPERGDTARPRLADTIAENQFRHTMQKVYTAYRSYEFVQATTTINNYINNDLSSFYFETAKDPLYTGSAKDRARIRKRCFGILEGLLKMLGPVLPLLVTEVLDHAPPTLRALLEPVSQPPFLAQPWVPRGHGKKQRSTRQATEPLPKTAKTLQDAAQNDKHFGTGVETSAKVSEPIGDESISGHTRQTAERFPLPSKQMLEKLFESMKNKPSGTGLDTAAKRRMQVQDSVQSRQRRMRQAAEPFLQILQTVKTLQEAARTNKHIGTGLETAVELTTDDELGVDYLERKMLECGQSTSFNSDTLPEDADFKTQSRLHTKDTLQQDLEELLVVSQVVLESRTAAATSETAEVLRQPRRVEDDPKRQWSYSKDIEIGGIKFTITVRSPDHEKCPRCWRWAAPHRSTVQVSPHREILCARCMSVMREKKQTEHSQAFEEWSNAVVE